MSLDSYAASLPGMTHHVASVNDTELHYVTAGENGSTVLLVHGFPETWWAFRSVIPLLATHHRVIVPDLRGFGDSAVASEGYTTADAAEDLHALIEHLGLGPVHLTGQDISGGVVFRLAATHPDDVLSLTAIESALAGFGAENLADVTHGGVWYLGALAAPSVASLLFEGRASEFIGDYLYPLYGVSADAVTPADVTEFARTYGRPGGFSGAAALYRGMLGDGDAQRELAARVPLTMPVTTIGTAGGDFTRSAFQTVSATPVTALRLDGVGHYVAQEAPERLAALLLDTFERASS